MSDEPDDFSIEYDGYDTWMSIDGVRVLIDTDDENEDEPVEVKNRVRGVQWRDVYGDDLLRTSAHYDEAHPQLATQERSTGLSAALLRISQSVSRLVRGRRVRGSDLE